MAACNKIAHLKFYESCDVHMRAPHTDQHMGFTNQQKRILGPSAPAMAIHAGHRSDNTEEGSARPSTAVRMGASEVQAWVLRHTMVGVAKVGRVPGRLWQPKELQGGMDGMR